MQQKLSSVLDLKNTENFIFNVAKWTPDFLISYLQNLTASCSKICTQKVINEFCISYCKNNIQIFICDICRSLYFMWEHYNPEIQILL